MACQRVDCAIVEKSRTNTMIILVQRKSSQKRERIIQVREEVFMLLLQKNPALNNEETSPIYRE
jgi:hypothetical protein